MAKARSWSFSFVQYRDYECLVLLCSITWRGVNERENIHVHLLWTILYLGPYLGGSEVHNFKSNCIFITKNLCEGIKPFNGTNNY
jgi:hypothetical protein